MKSNKAITIYLSLGALIIWFSIALQFAVSLTQLNNDFFNTLKLFLSYFTVTTNIIAGICFVSMLLVSRKPIGSFFARPTVFTAITIYILVVAIIYNFLLRGLVHPVGWARIADELLHVVNPIIILTFWIMYVDKSNLSYKHAFNWLIYPLIYIHFTAVIGVITKRYPYPFINVNDLGYPKALLNAVFCLLLFYSLSIFMIWLGKRNGAIKAHIPR